MDSFDDRMRAWLLQLVMRYFPHDRDGFIEAVLDLIRQETKRSFVNGLKAQSKSGQRSRRPALTYVSALKNGKLHPKQRATEGIAA